MSSGLKYKHIPTNSILFNTIT